MLTAAESVALAAFNVRQGPAIEVGRNRLPFAGRHGMRGSVPASLARTTRPGGGRRWSGGSVRRDNDIARPGRWRAAASARPLPLHKAQIALRVETGANMFRRFAIDIEFDKRR